MSKMKRMTIVLSVTFVMGLVLGIAIALVVSAEAQSPSPATRTEMAPTGKLRVAFPVNALTAPKNVTTGELGGLTADVGRELARLLGVPYEPVEFATPGKFIEVAGGDVWDIAVLSPDPARAKVADWSGAVFELDYTYLVPPNSKLTTSAEVDQPGVRVGAVRGDSQELVVTRVLKNGEVVRFEGWPATMEALRDGKVDAVAGNRVTLPTNAKELPGSRILDDGFAKQELVLYVPKGRPAALAYVQEFVKQSIASGLVQQIIDRSGRPGLKVGSGQ
jgi:polar amino acid transport system substrate-binding protein